MTTEAFLKQLVSISESQLALMQQNVRVARVLWLLSLVMFLNMAVTLVGQLRSLK
jgi:hypothetical protein